jgi:GxxExxY protein
MDEHELTEKIIGGAMAVQSGLGAGFNESVYRNALAHELSKAGLRFQRHKAINVHYDGVIVGEFEADVIVEEKVLLELKAVQYLVSAHEVQLVNYLTATKIDLGLLLNFGAARLEFKRKVRTLQKPSDPDIVL